MKPISNFCDHRALKYDEQRAIFVIKYSTRPEIYLSTSQEVKRILPISIKHDNVGDSYKELVQFNFVNEEEEDYVKIHTEDLQDLINMLKSIGLDLPIPDRLCRYLDSYEDD